MTLHSLAVPIGHSYKEVSGSHGNRGVSGACLAYLHLTLQDPLEMYLLQNKIVFKKSGLLQ